MAELKTKVNNASVTDFIKKAADGQKLKDSLVLLDLFKKVTREEPKMWGTSIIGFGMYHYKSKKSSQEGDWPLTGFSPRKANLTLYVTPGYIEMAKLLEKLGKHKTSKGCLYINKLSDIDLKVLEEIIKKSFKEAIKVHSKYSEITP